MPEQYDAVVVGAGPNGLAAAIELAGRGREVVVLEAGNRAGGGLRSEELTRPGFVHDVFSAVHPMAVGSPFFQRLELERHGLEWVHPDVPVAHPLDDGPAAVVHRSVQRTAETLEDDGRSYRRLFEPFARQWKELAPDLLGPLGLPGSPLLMARFGLRAARSARGLATGRFTTERARALFAGHAAHSVLELERSPSAAVGLVLGTAAHAVGWPFPRGGAERLAEALQAELESRGGRVRTGHRVESLDELAGARTVLLDLTPAQVLQLAGSRLPDRYRERLSAYRYGPGAFKVDWALSEPIPWSDPECARAGTVHVGGTLDEVAASEAAVWRGEVSPAPFVLLAQHSLFDETRAPPGRHTAWAYCHVPNGYGGDVTELLEGQVERFAPGFRDTILARAVHPPARLEAENRNLVGGDVSGGAPQWGQLFRRPTSALRPYRTPLPGVFLCSSSTPPGGGVHGMCGYHAARAALSERGIT